MTRKLIAETRIRYKDTTFEIGNSFLCDDADVPEMLREKLAKEYPKPSTEVQDRINATVDKIFETPDIVKSTIKKGRDSLKLNLVCEGLMFGYTGFAEAIRNLVYFLHAKDCNITIKPHDTFKLADSECIIGASVDILNTKKGKILNSLSNVKYNNKYKTAHITMTVPLGVTRQDDYSIGFVMFETQKIPKIFIDSLMKNTDELWTPSTFNKKNFAEAGYSKPIFIMPLGVDIDRFNPNKIEPLNIGLQNKFIFMAVMGWSERKGISTLVEAYLREFSRSDDTVLYLKGGWYDNQQAKNEVAQVVSRIREKDYPEIKIDFKLYSNDLLPRLYKRANCFVLPSLGEGWGLNYTEAMAMELPTIGTRATSLVDFMNDKNSFLIDVNEYRPEPRCDWICSQYIGENFAIPSMEHLQKLMREVYENKKLAEQRGKQARRDMVKKYQWKHACTKWFKRLKELEVILV